MEVDEHQLRAEYKDLKTQLSRSDVYRRPDYPQLSKRHKDLQDIIHLLDKIAVYRKQLQDAQALSKEEDQNLAALAESEVKEIEETLSDLKVDLHKLLSEEENAADKNCLVEIRAGVGGDEASLFAADLYRMYVRFAEKKSWTVELITQSASEVGGLKEVIFEVGGQNTYRFLQLESGVHRVQRIPTTESQGRVHTSTASVAVMPKADAAEITLETADLRIDTYRSSGHGGQSVNTTDSAVRVTHLPSGLVVTCQDEKSQFKNKSRALEVLRSRLLQQKMDEEESATSSQRQKMIGRAMRNEKIRTYNFPQDRLTDHRIKTSFYNLNHILDGHLDPLINKLSEIK